MRNINIKNDTLLSKINIVLTNLNSFSIKHILINNLKDEISTTLVKRPLSFIKNVICHCDCVFKSKTALAIILFHFIPRCQYYCAFFAFRRTGTHPPYFFNN